MHTAAARARERFAATFGVLGHRPVLASAPGRINLIGEHTDYTEGFALPMAIDRRVAVVARPRSDRVLRAHAVTFDETRDVQLDALDAARGEGWFAYVAGTAWALGEAGVPLTGAELAIASDVPVGAGLSSSAALEVAVARALVDLAGTGWTPRTAAVACRRAENDFVGAPCGIMDQMTAASATRGAAMLLDCRSLETTPVPIPSKAAIVVIDSGVRHAVAEGWYGQRVAACQRALAAAQVAVPGVRAIRDLDQQTLQRLVGRVDGEAFRCASHIVAENARVHAVVDAFADGDLAEAGKQFTASHRSLRDLYRVSCPEVDALVEVALGLDGCYGARMTGGGFGGCVVALVDASRADAVVRGLEAESPRVVPSAGVCFRAEPAGGADLDAR